MQIERCRDVEEYLARAGAFLAVREACHNLIFGICSTLRSAPDAYGKGLYLAVVLAGEKVVAAPLRTPPYNLVLSEIDNPGSLDVIADDVRDVFGSLPGVIGPKEAAAHFIKIWEERSGQAARLQIAERVFACSAVATLPPIEGEMRNYTEEDREIVLSWLAEFQMEALIGVPEEVPEKWLERVSHPPGEIALWDFEGPRSLAVAHGSTPNGIRIGPVYTPPEWRGRGYATALVAALTRRLLDGGRRFCFLFTDLSNPTSNNIYRRIGYEPVRDFDMYSFDEPVESA